MSNIRERIAKIIDPLGFVEGFGDPTLSLRKANQITQIFRSEIERMPALSDKEIREAMAEAMREGQEYGDDGNPLPERKVALAEKADILRKLREE